MPNQVRIFVSHHHSPEEDAFTARLVADLQVAGADVWVDDERIPSGDFVRKINEGLAGRQWLVLVMTPDALHSQWVQAEVNAALHQVNAGRMSAIIPLVARPCREPDIPVLWATWQRYDATRDYSAAIAGICRAMGLPTPMPTPNTPPHSAPSETSRKQPTPPVSPTAPSAAPDWLPSRLKDLGFVARSIGTHDIIVPPVVQVPAGSFLMGSKKKQAFYAETKNELPQHTVTLPAYEIGKFPVTVAEYACYIRAGGQEPEPSIYGRNVLDWRRQYGRPDHPVACISWHEAVAYAAWLAKLTGQPWRLPTEAEWEKAASWDPYTQRAMIYPWGDHWDKQRCNTQESKIWTTTPVGAFKLGTSALGAYDMIGNVCEWTSSCDFMYPYNANDGREGLDTRGSRGVIRGRVMRGASFVTHHSAARCASRHAGLHDERGVPDIHGHLMEDGFRLVLATRYWSS